MVGGVVGMVIMFFVDQKLKHFIREAVQFQSIQYSVGIECSITVN